MQSSRPSFRWLHWSAAGGVGVLIMAAMVSILGGRAAEGRAAEERIVDARPASVQTDAADEAAPAEADSTPSSTSTTSTTTPPTTTPPTTVPRPAVTAVAVVRSVAPAVAGPTPEAPDGPSAPAADEPAPASASAADRCAAAHQWVEAHGLVLPAGYGFRCPGPALQGETPRWGITCWNCQGAGSYIAIDIDRIGASDANLRYVIAHETCHAIDFATLGLSTEIGADLCAALHGAPR